MTWMFVKRARLAAAGFFVLAGLPPAHAVNVQPLSLEMVSIGSNSRANIQVVNDGAAPMPVEVVLKKLEIAEDGKTTEIRRTTISLCFPRKPSFPRALHKASASSGLGRPTSRKARATCSP